MSCEQSNLESFVKKADEWYTRVGMEINQASAFAPYHYKGKLMSLTLQFQYFTDHECSILKMAEEMGLHFKIKPSDDGEMIDIEVTE